MAGENDDVLVLSYCHFGFLFPVAGVEENERYPWQGYRFHPSQILLLALGSAYAINGSLRAPG